MQHPFTSAPRTIMVLCNLVYSVGAYMADWSESHVLNPRWPPHARFHNGQTMSLGALLAGMSLYLLSRDDGSGKRTTDSVKLAAVVGSFYTLAGLSAILYPGTDWSDPEHYVPYAPNAWIFAIQLVVNFFAYRAEVGRMEAAALKQE